jgi:RNA methyltransferase, TrmH family
LSRGKEKLLARLTRRRGRERERLVLIEGHRVVETVLGGGHPFRFALLSTGSSREEDRVAGALEEKGTEVRVVEPEVLRGVSDTETPQGLLAVVEEPSAVLPTGRAVAGRGGIVLVLDQVQDPGNVGTLIRSAAALGAERVLVLDGTADPWSPKAVRASAGFSFRIPVHRLSLGEALDWLEASRTPLLVAEASGTDVRLLRLVGRPLERDAGGPKESAGSGDTGPEFEGSELEESGCVGSELEGSERERSEGQTGTVHEEEKGGGPSGETRLSPEGVQGTSHRSALLLGNEAAGPREEAVRRAEAAVALPMSPGVESLNVAVAGSILLWALGPGRLDAGGGGDADVGDPSG